MSWLALPGGVLASLACHAVLILWAVGIFDSAKPLAAPPLQSIAVDLVPANEAPQKTQPPPRPKEPEPEPEPERETKPTPSDARSTPPEFEQLRPTLAMKQARWAPPPPAPAPAPVRDTGRASPEAAEQKAALAARLADTMQLPDALPVSPGDTRPAETAAKLKRDIIAEFRSHLNKCWIAPPRSADARRLKVLIRVAFNRHGTFLQEPIPIGGTPSAAGPVLMQSAMRALQQCQPYDFLPADQYKEWKVLDLAFSPAGLL